MLSKKQKKWIEEKRGHGELSNYKPWIKISDISSSGRSHRVFGHKTRRTHHLMSDLELATFLILEWSPNVTDIREQFPLQYEDTQDLATLIKVKHPSIRGELHIMTSDFYVITSARSQNQFALQAKYSKDLNNPRVIEKLEIERRYWQSKDIPWQIVTEKDIPLEVQNNIKWLYPESDSEIDADFYSKINFYAEQILKNPNNSTIGLCKEIDNAYHSELGTSLNDLRILLAQRFFTFDLRIDFRKLKCRDLRINQSESWNVISEEILYVSNQ
ncbi:TnsA endonuclease N-terminal domain-containing protein [Psychrobacter arenosus]|uniref:TnsA endonuclease N-terminal domain-containing protein n=1 Tax=Psychrobacter arenosus TaxID=256326 RepID=UPI00191865BD|nr:TnsA endonuclease N-terminal domain-containing protein [Psychrobacter arenosus]